MKQIIFISMFLSAVFVTTNTYANNPTNGTEKKDDMNGLVTSSDSRKPIEGVTITAFLNTKKENTVTSDEDGIYSFDELKPGTYKIVFEKTGYKKVTKEKIIIKENETFRLNVEMNEAPELDIMPSPFGNGMHY